MVYGVPYYYAYIKYVIVALIIASLPLVALVVLKIIQKATLGRCRSLVCLVGKTAIVTGGCSGLGFQTAIALASRGAKVILADKEDATKAQNKIIEKTHNKNIIFKQLDLKSLNSIRKFAKEINETEERLDLLINNAGIGLVNNKYTDDGLHPIMQVNHFGPFLLTHLLTDLLKKSAPSRIIFVSSAIAFINNLSLENLNYPEQPFTIYNGTKIYANSKVCNVITANGFAEKLKDSGVTSNSLHPGMVNTNIYFKTADALKLGFWFSLPRMLLMYAYGKSAEEGAQTIIHLALCNKLKNVTGKHFWDCKTFPSPPGTWNKTFVESIWNKTEELVGLKPEEKLKSE